MTQFYTERSACELYRRAICDHRSTLESVLSPQPWIFLQRSGCLREEDVEAINEVSTRPADRIKKLVDFILEKDDIGTYTKFCKAVHTKTKKSSKVKAIFPFADSVGGLPVTEPKKGTAHVLYSSYTCVDSMNFCRSSQAF